jgi:hypothetical protein
MELYLLPFLNAFMTLYRDIFYFLFCFRSALFLFEFETASLLLLSETVFCYGTVPYSVNISTCLNISVQIVLRN